MSSADTLQRDVIGRPWLRRAAWAAMALALWFGLREYRRQARSVAALEARVEELSQGANDRRAAAAALIPVAASLRGALRSASSPPAVALRPHEAQAEPATDSENDRPASGPAPVIKKRLPAPELRRRFEKLFVGDAPADAWANRASQLVREKLPAMLPAGSEVRSFDCRSSVCRLVTANKGRAGSLQFLETVGVNLSARLWNAAAFSAPLNDDPEDGLMVTYIAREGEGLPDLAD